MDIHLPAKYLAAASFCQATNDVRFMLNGICIRREADQVQVLGTDGHVLVVIDTGLPAGDDPDTIIRLTRDQQAQVRRRANADAVVHLNGDFNLNGCNSPLEVVDGTFPDCKTLWESATRDPAGDPPAFNPALLAKFVSVAKAVMGEVSTPTMQLIQHGAHNATEVQFPCATKVRGLIMPVRQ